MIPSKLDWRVLGMQSELYTVLDDDLSDAMDAMAAELADEFGVDAHHGWHPGAERRGRAGQRQGHHGRRGQLGAPQRRPQQSVPALRAAAAAYAGDVPSEVLDLLLHAAEVIEFYQEREELADLGI